MSAELDALEALAANFNSGIYRVNPLSLAVLFYAIPFWQKQSNWLSNDPLDEITRSDWDKIEAYVSGLLFEMERPLIGYIMPYITSSPPPNVLPCDGAMYARVDFPELYAALDDAFIIDADNFFVPDLRGRTVIGVGGGTGLTSRNVGDEGGEEAHQLTEGELASHVHSVGSAGTSLAVAPGELPVLIPSILSTSTGSTGGDESHNNMQPFLALNYGVIAS